MAKKSTGWVPVWQVASDGQSVREARAKIGEHRVKVSGIESSGVYRGGDTYDRFHFDSKYSLTREGAVDAFIAYQRRRLEMARNELASAQLLIERGQALRENAAPELQKLLTYPR